MTIPDSILVPFLVVPLGVCCRGPTYTPRVIQNATVPALALFRIDGCVVLVPLCCNGMLFFNYEVPVTARARLGRHSLTWMIELVKLLLIGKTRPCLEAACLLETALLAGDGSIIAHYIQSVTHNPVLTLCIFHSFSWVSRARRDGRLELLIVFLLWVRRGKRPTVKLVRVQFTIALTNPGRVGQCRKEKQNDKARNHLARCLGGRFSTSALAIRLALIAI